VPIRGWLNWRKFFANQSLDFGPYFLAKSKTIKKDFFIGLPQGKTTGICEQFDFPDEVRVANIYADCVNCSVPKCMMFEVQKRAGKMVRVFTKHEPEWL
jgi:hypothetical protein